MKNFKKVLALVLSVVMMLGTFTMTFAAEGTGNEKVDKLVEMGLVKGDAATGDLRLADTINRDEVAVMIVRALGLEDSAISQQFVPNHFTDVITGEWNNGYVNVAAGAGIVIGSSATTFSPKNPINYAEAATMLLRVIKGITPEEEKTAVWPSTYLVKAQNAGLFDGVSVDYNAKATRENLFNMVYNALTNDKSGLLIANTIEGIVVENYRTENISKDEVIVHVMKDQVQKTGSKYYEEGDEYRLVLTPELKKQGLDVETLLGKVITVSIDKNDVAIDVKVDSNYSYLQGNVDDINAKDIKVAGRWYTIGKAESRTAVDERLYQVYKNNEDVYFENLYKEVKRDEFERRVEYAKITVRNGKVLFIDAFQFEDIAPVAEDITDKDVVVYYNDTDGGETAKLTVDSKAFVIDYDYDTQEVSLGDNEEIEAYNVIHWYKDYKKNLTVFVGREAVVGEYKDASAKKAKDANDILIKVDSEEYRADIKTEKRNPVYSTLASELVFETLTEDYDEELAGFKNQEVTLLLDMFGKVQLIGSDKIDGRFWAIISDTSRSHGDIKLLKSDNDNSWYETNRSTSYKNVGGNTQDKQFDKFTKYDLVRVTADEDKLIKILEKETGTAQKVTAFNKNVIDFSNEAKPVAGEDFYYIGKNAVIFVASDLAAMDIAKFLDTYYHPAHKDYKQADHEIEAYVADSTKGDVAKVIVVTAATKIKSGDDTYKVQVDRVRFSGNDYFLTVTNGKGETSTHKVKGDVKKVNDRELTLDGVLVKAGVIIEVKVSKNDDKDITAINEVVLKDAKKVHKYDYDTAKKEYFVQFANNEKIWISQSADRFGGSIETGDYVQYTETDKYDVTNLIVLVDGPTEEKEVKGLVTYINDTRIFIDGERYAMDEDTVLYDKDGKTVKHVGGENINGFLTTDSLVKDVKVKDNVVTEMTLVKTAAEIEEEEAAKAKEEADKKAAAEVAKLVEAIPAEITAENLDAAKEAVNAARVAYDKLNDEAKVLAKTSLEAIEAAEAKIEELNIPVNGVVVRAEETATGIGRILTVEKTGYETAAKYLLKNAEGTELNKGGEPAEFSVETIVVFEKEGDTVTVELYDVEGNVVDTLNVVIK